MHYYGVDLQRMYQLLHYSGVDLQRMNIHTTVKKKTNAIHQNSLLLDFFEFDTIAHAHRHLCIYHNAVTSSKAKNGIIVVLT